jgi:phosphoglycolate phosphatase-like HAD superfamily hydrolase
LISQAGRLHYAAVRHKQDHSTIAMRQSLGAGETGVKELPRNGCAITVERMHTSATTDYSPRFLPGTEIELVGSDIPRGRFKSVLFDFDGTLSLVREGWPDVMIPMMVRILRGTGTRELEVDLSQVVEDFVMRLNGRQTIYQMIQLADEVRKRGGTPRDPLDYKHEYHDLLWQRIDGRVRGLREGTTSAEHWTVPGARQLLAALRNRGLKLYLASGTDLKYVREEAAAIGVAEFFGPHIYGALDDYQNFSKKMIIDRILSENGLSGDELLGFGDGFVEIEEVKRVGGVAVGVASDEVSRAGTNQWKRNRLTQAGADIIIPEYRQQGALLNHLFDQSP